MSPTRCRHTAIARITVALAWGVALGAALAAPAAAEPALATSRSYALADTILSCFPNWFADGDQLDGRFGTVAPAGDVDRDGYDDLLVGAYNYDRGEIDEGVVFLFRGGPAGLEPSPSWSAEANQAGARLGDKLSGCGDVNGDGYADVILGAAFYDSTHADAGAAFLYLGSDSGLCAEPAWIAIGDQNDAQFGACVQRAGDVNGDGYDDAIVGSWLYDHGQTNEGRAFLYYGSDSGLVDIPAWIGESDVPNAAYGYFCASAGDVNHDGFADIVVGARRFGGNGLAEEGRVYVYHGSKQGLSLAADWVHDGGRAESEFGSYTISAGDVNGDEFGDLLVGAFRYEGPDLDEGKAWLFMGSATGLDSVASWAVEGGVPRNNFGYHLDSAGDVNGDGYGDVIVSAPGVDTDNFQHRNVGQATVYLGGPEGLSTSPAWSQYGDQDFMSLEAVRGAGDVNGDGYDDVATGSLYRDGDEVDSGRAFVFYGCLGSTTEVLPSAAPALALELTGPNPFTRATSLAFSTSVAGAAHLAVYDLHGRIVANLIDGVIDPGRHTVAWNGRVLNGRLAPAGIYLAILAAAGETRAVKLVRIP